MELLNKSAQPKSRRKTVSRLSPLRPLKSIITVLISFNVLFDPTIGSLTWLHYKKIMVKKEVERQIKAGVDRDKLVLFKLSPEEARTKLRWLNAKEFEYNHQLYDVVEKMTVGDMVYYWCWDDREETELSNQLKELAAQALGTETKTIIDPTQLISSLRSLYGLCSFKREIPKPGLLCHHHYLFYCLYSSIPPQPPSPPPRFIG